jgi:hypothetical protein
MKQQAPRTPEEGPELALVTRIFAVLAAVLLVGSLAIVSVLPADMTLVQGLAALDGALPEHLQAGVMGSVGHFAWMHVFMPFLVRPVWFIPVCLGVMCVGGAVTTIGHAAPKTRQRRS